MDLTDTKVKCVAPSEVTCVSISSPCPDEVNIVVGCRDHSVRLFKHSFTQPSCQISPSITFKPPHLDTVCIEFEKLGTLVYQNFDF